METIVSLSLRSASVFFCDDDNEWLLFFMWYNDSNGRHKSGFILNVTILACDP